MSEENGDKNYLCMMSYIMKYFELHANQRIMLFRFYIVFATIFIYGLGYLAIRFPRKGDDEEWLAILISVCFVVVTCIFRKLDMRNRQLIHNAEDALELLENNFDSIVKVENKSFKDVEKIKIFTYEHSQMKSGQACMGHTDCFKWIYGMACCVGVFFIVVSLSRLGIINFSQICHLF